MTREQIKHTASEIVRGMTNYNLSENQQTALKYVAREVINNQIVKLVEEELERRRYPEELYDDKEFYEVLSNGQEIGPVKGIREVVPNAPGYSDYKYCQIVENKVVAVFKEDELILKDK